MVDFRGWVDFVLESATGLEIKRFEEVVVEGDFRIFGVGIFEVGVSGVGIFLDEDFFGVGIFWVGMDRWV